MAFVSGLLLIDSQASALNNLGSIPGERFDNSVGVKVIRAKDGLYPYVSAQAFKYWLRNTLQQSVSDWKAAPVYREEKIAYTDSNPIAWWDDDLFGYMRAPSERASAKAKREADQTRVDDTGVEGTITRVAPFRVSTLVSISPVTITSDFGVMARQEGDPVLHEHQFYRATLKGLLSLDLKASGTFWYKNKTGFKNLDEIRRKKAEERGLEHLESEKAYRLPVEERLKRVSALFEGLSVLDGGAKQALHYTDVAPPLVMLAVIKGGNSLFGYVVGANAKGLPEIRLDALEEALTVFDKDILSDVFVGWARGYLDAERARLEEFAAKSRRPIHVSHPREAFLSLVSALRDNPAWMD